MIKIALFDIKSNRQMYDGTIFLINTTLVSILYAS